MAAKKYNGKDLSLMFDTQEFNADGTQVVLDNEEGDQESVTFAEVAVGAGRLWFFTLTAIGDYASGTVWDLLWSNSGQTIPFVFKPYGNAAATVEQPHFTGDATVVTKPPIGGTAGETWTYEARLDVVGEPVRVTV